MTVMQQNRPNRTLTWGRVRVTYGGGMPKWGVQVFHGPRHMGHPWKRRGQSIYFRTPWRTVSMQWLPSRPGGAS